MTKMIEDQKRVYISKFNSFINDADTYKKSTYRERQRRQRF